MVIKFSKFLVDNLPQAVLSVIDEAGHMMVLEKPNLINEAIRYFIKGGMDNVVWKN
ncbi:alpha/beta fold hydrolase [Desulfofarcimen acetoxidans]|uniref:alpha/beta fold hydrolase n=1 Tax=Desulfofarcimen acetoxidans TaxID=58138 RepID=UPI00019E5886|nr:alpha/beta hydrolase [Desulfofarcimen acetoxidans]